MTVRTPRGGRRAQRPRRRAAPLSGSLVRWLMGSLAVAGTMAACGDGDATTTASSRPDDVSVVGPDGSPVTFATPVATADPAEVSTSSTASTPPGASASPGPPSSPSATGAAGPAPGSTAGPAAASSTSAGPAPPSATTGPVVVTPAPVPTPVPTTAAPTTVGPTAPPSTQGAPVCDLELVLRQTETTFEDITAEALACAGSWASWSGFPNDPTLTDGYFAVAEWNGFAWQLRNLGTSLVCTEGGVPPELWDALGCFE